MELIEYKHPYYFQIGNFRGEIYLHKDIPLDIVTDQIIESLRTDLEDRSALLKNPRIEVWNTSIKIFTKELSGM